MSHQANEQERPKRPVGEGQWNVVIALTPTIVSSCPNAQSAIVLQQMWFWQNIHTNCYEDGLNKTSGRTGLSRRAVQRAIQRLSDQRQPGGPFIKLEGKPRADQWDQTNRWSFTERSLAILGDFQDPERYGGTAPPPMAEPHQGYGGTAPPPMAEPHQGYGGTGHSSNTETTQRDVQTDDDAVDAPLSETEDPEKRVSAGGTGEVDQERIDRIIEITEPFLESGNLDAPSNIISWLESEDSDLIKKGLRAANTFWDNFGGLDAALEEKALEPKKICCEPKCDCDLPKGSEYQMEKASHRHHWKVGFDEEEDAYGIGRAFFNKEESRLDWEFIELEEEAALS